MCVGKEVAGSQYGSLRLSPFQPSRTAARLNIQIPREQRYILYFHFSETFLYITNDFQGFGKYPPSKKTHKQNHRFLRQKHRILLSGMGGRPVIEIVNWYENFFKVILELKCKNKCLYVYWGNYIIKALSFLQEEKTTNERKLYSFL